MMPDCKTCMHKPESVSYTVFESSMARQERTIRRVWILVIIVLALFVGSNALWILHESQMEVVEENSVELENDNGYVNYIGNDGDIYNGTDQSYKDETPRP